MILLALSLYLIAAWWFHYDGELTPLGVVLWPLVVLLMAGAVALDSLSPTEVEEP